MKLFTLEVPEEPAYLADWLEAQLMGPRLAGLVAELTAVHRPWEAAGSIREALGPALDAVLTSGLGVLGPAAIGWLLRRPGSLLELQEQILIAGGPYWERWANLPSDDDLGVTRVRGRLGRFLDDEAARLLVGGLRLVPLRWYRRPWIVAPASAAAAALLALGVASRIGPSTRTLPETAPAVAWGWARPGAMNDDLPRAAYLEHLADAADQWFARRPESATSLARRLGEFRQGCSALIFAEHRALSAADRRWLTDRCRAWAGAIDRQLAALEAGADPGRVRSEADATIRKLAEALRRRASDAGRPDA